MKKYLKFTVAGIFLIAINISYTTLSVYAQPDISEKVRTVDTSQATYVEDFKSPFTYNGKLHFVGTSGEITEATGKPQSFIYQYDGKNVTNLKIRPGDAYESEVQTPIILKDELIFGGILIPDLLKNHVKRIRYDGEFIQEIPDSRYNYPSGFEYPVVCNNKLYYVATGQYLNIDIFEYDGSSTKSIFSKSYYQDPIIYNLIVLDNFLYFNVKTNTTNQIYEYNGIDTKLSKLGDKIKSIGKSVKYNNSLIISDEESNSNLFYVNNNSISEIEVNFPEFKAYLETNIIYNGDLYFLGSIDSEYKIFEYNGKILKVLENNNFSINDADVNFTIQSGALYFKGGTNDKNSTILKYDGKNITATEFVNLSDYKSGFDETINLNGNTYFQGKNKNQLNLYKFDGSNILKVENNKTGFLGEYNTPFVNNGKLYINGFYKNIDGIKHYKLFEVY